MSGSEPQARTVRCPACGGPSVYAPSNPSRPFCSVRCRNHDLGAWASESYRVAAAPDPDDLLDPDTAEPLPPGR
jgi:uncharacterized protein